MTTITINGKDHSFNGIDPAMPLLWALRDHAGIQGVNTAVAWANAVPALSGLTVSPFVHVS